MSYAATNDLVLEISRDLIAQVAPAELPLFRATSQAFFQDPKRVLAGQRGSDDMLGFGLGDAVELLTPAALAIVSSVLTFLVAEMAKATKAESASLIQESVRQLFKKFQPSTNHATNNVGVNQQGKQRPHLTTEQLTQIRSITLKQAHQMKLSDTRAKVLADAIVGSLAISTGV